jgi:thiol-disulfide isomerase/thioredoxin
MRSLVTALILTLAACTGCEGDSTPEPARKVIAFTATWCGPCQRDKPALADMERKGVTIVHVDIDADPALAQQYKIKTVPTYVVCEGDKEVERTGNIRRLFKLIRWLRRL